MICAANLLPHFSVIYRSLLGLDLLDTTFQIGTWGPITLVHTGYEQRCVGEEMVHLLEGSFCGLGKEAVEEYRVGKVANLCID